MKDFALSSALWKTTLRFQITGKPISQIPLQPETHIYTIRSLKQNRTTFILLTTDMNTCNRKGTKSLNSNKYLTWTSEKISPKITWDWSNFFKENKFNIRVSIKKSHLSCSFREIWILVCDRQEKMLEISKCFCNWVDFRFWRLNLGWWKSDF